MGWVGRVRALAECAGSLRSWRDDRCSALPLPLRARGGPALRRLREDEYLGGKERGMNGTHRDPGVVFLSQAAELAGASLLDIAPTVLAVMGVQAPPMEGRALLGFSDGIVVEPFPDSFVPEAAPYTPEEEAQIEERLRALGYFE